MSRRPALLGSLALVALASATGPATGNMARSRHSAAGFVTGTADDQATEVVGEELVFDCREDESAEDSDTPVCSFRAAYTVNNASPADEVVHGAFVGIRTSGVSIALDGTPVHRAATPAETEALARSLREPRETAAEREAREPREEREASGGAKPAARELTYAERLHSETLYDSLAEVRNADVVPFEARFPGGRRAALVAAGLMHPGEYYTARSPYMLDAIRTRHLLLAKDRGSRHPHHYDFLYPIYPIHTWRGRGPITIRVRYPKDWRIAGGVRRTDDGLVAWRQEGPGEATIVVDSSQGKALWLRLTPPDPWPIYPGGPMLALGRKLGDGFRLRAGYEFAAPHWLVHSLTVDTDFSSHLVATPMVEAATPGSLFLLLPSFSAGVGLPVRILPEPQLGFRTMAGFNTLFGLGLQTTVDWYPATPTSDRDRVDVLMMGRMSL